MDVVVGRPTRLGILALLILAGPIGWIVAVLIYSRGEYLAVEVPFSGAARERLTDARRLRNIGAGIMAVGSVLLLIVSQSDGSDPLLALAVMAAGLVVIVLGEAKMREASVGLSLDASRRWVTLRGVHPAFALAAGVETARP